MDGGEGGQTKIMQTIMKRATPAHSRPSVSFSGLQTVRLWWRYTME